MGVTLVPWVTEAEWPGVLVAARPLGHPQGLHPWEKEAGGVQPDCPPTRAPRQVPVPVGGKESLEARVHVWPRLLRAQASQEAFPEGHCISMVTVLGVPPAASPSSAPSLRALWKTTLRGSHSRCDLSLPARK